MQLNLGCGRDYREGWLNVDFPGSPHEIDLAWDPPEPSIGRGLRRVWCGSPTYRLDLRVILVTMATFSKGGTHTKKRRSGPWATAEERRNKVVELIAEGYTIQSIANQLGFVPGTYASWRQRYPEFAARCDHARGSSVGNQAKWAGDFTSFRKIYLGFETYFHQQMIVRSIEHSPPQSVSMVLVPPEHGKTTVIEDWITFKLATAPNTRITIVSEGQPHARKIMRRVQARFSDIRSKLYADFGPFYEHGQERRGKPWQSDFFTVCQADHDERDYCADEETEILTTRGWLTHDQLQVGDLAYTLDHDLGVGRWSPVSAVNRFEAKPRTMVSMEGQGHSSLTTRDHRWPVRHRSYDTGRDGRIWRTSESLTQATSLVTAAPCLDLPSESKFSDAFVELMAWYWTEGSINKNGDNNWRVQIGQSHRKNPEHVGRIRRCLLELFGPAVKGLRNGIGWSELAHEGRGMTLFNVWTDGARKLEEWAPGKQVRAEFVASLTAAQLHLFIETSLDADGWRSNGQICISQKDRPSLEGFLMAAALRGDQPQVSYSESIGMWCVTLYRRGGGYRAVKTLETSTVEHSGMVWCPTTETGTWMARRNGSVYFTGNSVEARGWRSAIAGTRTDYLIIDDVTSTRNHTSADDIVATLRQDFFTRPGKEGHTIIVGTRVNVADVYEQLLEARSDMGQPLVTNSVILPATDEDGKSLCPEMWDEPQLERKRAIVGEAVWWRNYQQKPQAAGDLTFSDEVLNKAKNHFIKLGEKMANSHTLLSLDPALGGGNAVMAWNYTETKMRVLDFRLDWGLARTEEIIARLDEMANLYGPIEDLVIETMAFQQALADDDRIRELAAKHGFRVLPHLTGSGGHSKLDEALGVGAMGTDMNKGLIEIPWGDLASQKRMDALIGEFKSWRPGVKGTKLKQDLVMSAWFGWILMKNRRKVLETMVTADGWKRKSLSSWSRPTNYQSLVRR